MSLPQSKLLIDLQGCWSCAVHKILCLQPCEDPVLSARSDKPGSIVHCLHHACAVSVPGWLHKQTLNATFGGRIYTISSRTALYPGLAKDTRSERMRQPSMREKLFGVRPSLHIPNPVRSANFCAASHIQMFPVWRRYQHSTLQWYFWVN